MGHSALWTPAKRVWKAPPSPSRTCKGCGSCSRPLRSRLTRSIWERRRPFPNLASSSSIFSGIPICQKTTQRVLWPRSITYCRWCTACWCIDTGTLYCNTFLLFHDIIGFYLSTVAKLWYCISNIAATRKYWRAYLHIAVIRFPPFALAVKFRFRFSIVLASRSSNVLATVDYVASN